MRFKKSLDENHKDIVDALKKCGVFVADLSGNGGGVPDIFTAFGSYHVFIEIKREREAKIKRAQIEFLANCPVYCGVVQTFEESLKLAKSPLTSDCLLKDAQKQKLRQFLAVWHEKALHLPTFFKVIGK